MSDNNSDSNSFNEEYNRWIKNYNSNSHGIDGAEKLLSLLSGLKTVQKSTDKHLMDVLTRFTRRMFTLMQCFQDMPFDEEKIKIGDTSDHMAFIFYELLAEFDGIKNEESFYDALEAEFKSIEILNTEDAQYIYSRDEYSSSYAEEARSILEKDTERWRAWRRASKDIAMLEVFIVPEIINSVYPNYLSEIEGSSNQSPEYLKKKDQLPGHAHRKQDIVEKYFALKDENPGWTKDDILEKVQVWYFELTTKEISKSVIRYHIGEK